MAGSNLFRDFQRAFALASGLRPVLRDVDLSGHTIWPSDRAKPLCVRMAAAPWSCAECRRFQRHLVRNAEHGVYTRECFAGFSETAVPVRTGQRVIAFLMVGQVRLKAPTSDDAARVAGNAAANRDALTLDQAYEGMWSAPYIAPPNYESHIELLEIFARQLGDWYVIHGADKLPPESIVMLRAREWIENHYHEAISLAMASGVAQTSVWNFSRTFHRTFGMKVSEYLGHLRIAHARQMLVHPRSSVTDIAYAVGYTSISQFNRSFRKFAGVSPIRFRAKLAEAHGATKRPAAAAQIWAVPDAASTT